MEHLDILYSYRVIYAQMQSQAFMVMKILTGYAIVVLEKKGILGEKRHVTLASSDY